MQLCILFQVLQWNVWGLPNYMGQGSKLKGVRIPAIAKEISKAKYDLYLLSELWLKKDYKKIRRNLPKNYSITDYHKLNSRCIEVLAPFRKYLI